jgi:hypothetical protein
MSVAGSFENVFRMIQTLPGVTGVNDFDGRVAVRGGGPDQNLTVMDGIEIHNPYRLFGITSAFNPETVERFELVTGAFHPRYGDRLSSILVVDTRSGRRERAVSGSAALGFTDANAVLEGRLPGPGQGSWLLTGRRTYYDLLLRTDSSPELPSFADIQAQLAWEPRPGQRLTVLALRSREGTFIADTGSDIAFRTRSHNEITSARFSTPLGQRWFLDSAASLYTSSDVMGAVEDPSALISRRPTPESPDYLIGRDVRLRDLSLREEAGYDLSTRHHLGFGGDVHWIAVGVAWQPVVNVNDGGLAPGPWTRPDGLGPLTDADLPTRLRGGLWVHDRFKASERLGIEAGLRLDHGGITPRTTLSPRLSAHQRLGGSTVLSAALGLHTQSTGFEKFLQRDYFFRPDSMFDLTRVGSAGLRSEKALHAVASLERTLAPGLDLRLEAFYKRFYDLIVGRLETEAERQARIAQYDFPASLQASIPMEPQITRVPANQGSGHSYGFELLLSRKATSPAQRLTGWVSYAYGVAEREAYGVRYPFDYDRRHGLSVVASLHAKRSIEIGATARFASGEPWTPPSGLRVAPIEDFDDKDGDGNRTELIPSTVSGLFYEYTLLPGGLALHNSARMPWYIRVDLRASFNPHGGRWTFYVEVINALDRHNPELTSTDWTRDLTTGRVTFFRKDLLTLPRLPSLGVHFRF